MPRSTSFARVMHRDGRDGQAYLTWFQILGLLLLAHHNDFIAVSIFFSLFIMQPIDQIPVHEEQFMPQSPPNELENTNHSTTLQLNDRHLPDLSETSATIYAPELTESIPPNTGPLTMVPTFYPAFIPVPLPFWAPNLTIPTEDQEMKEAHEIVKPIPVVPKEALNVELVGLSKLSIGEAADSRTDPSALSLKLAGSSTPRQSAFHVSSPVALPDLNQSNSSPIHAV